jgi:hypothetical protein
MRLASTPFVLLSVIVLNSCGHESNPEVARSSVRIEAAKRGDLQLPTGSLRDAVYVEKPALCTCAPNTEGTLFVLGADGRSATQVKTLFGQSAGIFLEVKRGINPGDRIIVSDMSAYYLYPTINLR